VKNTVTMMARNCRQPKEQVTNPGAKKQNSNRPQADHGFIAHEDRDRRKP
jgi:hypothetical protein